MRSLYITQTGITDNLGQSQVLPYLRGLVRRGVEIDLITHELSTLGAKAREEIAETLLSKDHIRWHPLEKVVPGSLQVRLLESTRAVRFALQSALQRRPDIIHGRSYFATAICDIVGEVSRKSKVLFDCRGMLGDEYVDCGYWTTDRLEYRLVKRYERRLFRRSDGIVVLTRALQHWLKETRAIGPRPQTEVIPCCVDLEKFYARDDARIRLRSELGLNDDAFTILYSGSLGSWYLEPEMARFAAIVRRLLVARDSSTRRPCVFVCFTPADATSLRRSLEAVGFPAADIIVRKIATTQIADYLSVGDIGLSFIQSCFSKKGSSPTKVAEYLACGNVVVVNGDIGDQADLAAETEACVVLRDFSESELEQAARRAIALVARPREHVIQVTADAARRHFGLEEVGVRRYAALYERLARASV